MTTKSKTKKFLENLNHAPLSLGDLLAAIRIGDELSMTEFSSLLGISRSHLNDIEKGKKSVSPHKACEYADTLGYSPEQFIRLSLQDLLTRNNLDDFEIEIRKKRA